MENGAISISDTSSIIRNQVKTQEIRDKFGVEIAREVFPIDALSQCVTYSLPFALSYQHADKYLTRASTRFFVRNSIKLE